MSMPVPSRGINLPSSMFNSVEIMSDKIIFHLPNGTYEVKFEDGCNMLEYMSNGSGHLKLSDI